MIIADQPGFLNTTRLRQTPRVGKARGPWFVMLRLVYNPNGTEMICQFWRAYNFSILQICNYNLVLILCDTSDESRRGYDSRILSSGTNKQIRAKPVKLKIVVMHKKGLS